MTLKSVDGSFTWGEFVGVAIVHAKDLFIKEMKSYIGSNELIGMKKEYINRSWVDTIYASKGKECSRLFFREKKTVYGNILRVTDILGPNRSVHVSREPPSFYFSPPVGGYVPPITGAEPLKCELFLVHPGLRDIAERVLEPMAKQLGYTRVEYIDASKDKSAWYPGEPRPEFPKARLLER